MTELARGEYEVAADGSFTMSLKFSGDPHHCTPEDLRRSSFPTTESYAKFLDGLGYKRRDTIGPFGSGSVLTTSGDKIVGREEPANRLGTTEEQIAEVTKILRDVYESDPDTKRAPLPGYGERMPFDSFGEGYEVYSDPITSGFAPAPAMHTSPTTADAYPANANLLKTA